MLHAGHISAAEIKEEAELYIKEDVVSCTADVLWLLSNAGAMDAKKLITMGYLLNKFNKG